MPPALLSRLRWQLHSVSCQQTLKLSLTPAPLTPHTRSVNNSWCLCLQNRRIQPLLTLSSCHPVHIPLCAFLGSCSGLSLFSCLLPWSLFSESSQSVHVSPLFRILQSFPSSYRVKAKSVLWPTRSCTIWAHPSRTVPPFFLFPHSAPAIFHLVCLWPALCIITNLQWVRDKALVICNLVQKCESVFL